MVNKYGLEMKWHLMSWRFLCCMLIACGYVHQQSSDEKYRKYFDHRLFQFKPLPLLPFLFHAYTYFQNTVLNFFSIGTFFFCIDKELCICSCCHHLISGFKRLSWFLDFFFFWMPFAASVANPSVTVVDQLPSSVKGERIYALKECSSIVPWVLFFQ